MDPYIKTKTKTETKAGEPARGREAPRVGVFTRFVSVFVFILIYGSISFIMNHIFYYDVKSKNEDSTKLSKICNLNLSVPILSKGNRN